MSLTDSEMTRDLGPDEPVLVKKNLAGLIREDILACLRSIDVPENALRMRSEQIWHWVNWRGVTNFEAMTNVSKAMRLELAAHFTLDRPDIVESQVSKDGTRKWLLRVGGGAEIETVFIPDKTRGTLCVSSQVGCTLNCRFCHTGTHGWVRNLTPYEIVAQLMIARDALSDWPEQGKQFDGNRAITNIVLMGMGEPLYNFDNVKTALEIISDGAGISLSKRRITLSTAGVVPQIARCGDEIGVQLAISLHAVRDDVRNEIVPLNKKYPIKDLLEACRNYPGVTNAKRITFEYVMLKGINDSLSDAKELVRLLRGIPAKVNLIPFNPWPGSPYECSDWEQIERFADILLRSGYASPVRTPRGRDIMAACGQLKYDSVKRRASEGRKQKELSV